MSYLHRTVYKAIRKDHGGKVTQEVRAEEAYERKIADRRLFSFNVEAM